MGKPKIIYLVGRSALRGEKIPTISLRFFSVSVAVPTASSERFRDHYGGHHFQTGGSLCGFGSFHLVKFREFSRETDRGRCLRLPVGEQLVWFPGWRMEARDGETQSLNGTFSLAANK